MLNEYVSRHNNKWIYAYESTEPMYRVWWFYHERRANATFEDLLRKQIVWR